MDDGSRMRWPQLVKELVSQTRSMTWLAQRIGTTQKEVRRWIQGTSKPSGDYADALLRHCRATGVNPKKFEGLVPVYDFRIEFDQNVSDGPQGIPSLDTGLPEIPTRFFDVTLNSPLGIPASVLTINSSWIGPLAALGYDVITAKTVRTRKVPAHPVVNCVYLPTCQQPVPVNDLPERILGSGRLPVEDVARISLANSFGMPSPEPREWQADLSRAKDLLQDGQVLIASVVATEDASPDAMVKDYIKCARLAAEVKPHAIELNASCPNVYGIEGSVHNDAATASLICRRVAKELPGVPILIKIGYLAEPKLLELFEATYKHVAGYTAINTIPVKIISEGQKSEPVFPPPRDKAGVSGVVIREYAIDMVTRLRQAAHAKRDDLVIIGVGGVSSAADVQRFRAAGANVVQMCTAPLLDPLIAAGIRRTLAMPEEGHAHSRLLKRAGAKVSCFDENTAEAFDLTFSICADSGVTLEQGIAALKKNWLDRYISEVKDISERTGAPARARRSVPTEAQIKAWIRNERRS